MLSLTGTLRLVSDFGGTRRDLGGRFKGLKVVNNKEQASMGGCTRGHHGKQLWKIDCLDHCIPAPGDGRFFFASRFPMFLACLGPENGFISVQWSARTWSEMDTLGACKYYC